MGDEEEECTGDPDPFTGAVTAVAAAELCEGVSITVLGRNQTSKRPASHTGATRSIRRSTSRGSNSNSSDGGSSALRRYLYLAYPTK